MKKKYRHFDGMKDAPAWGYKARSINNQKILDKVLSHHRAEHAKMVENAAKKTLPVGVSAILRKCVAPNIDFADFALHKMDFSVVLFELCVMRLTKEEVPREYFFDI